MPKIQIGDADYYYELTGKGHPLILISGYSCDHTIWQGVVECLKDHYTLLTIDNRGIGQTSDSGGNLSLNLMAEDILEISKKLGLSKPHIAGHSMGGAITQVIANKAGLEIGKIAIINSTSKIRIAALYALESLLKLRRKGIDFETLFESSFPLFYGEDFLAEAKNILQLKQLIVQNPYPQTLKGQERQFHLLQNVNTTEKLQNITSQSLVIYGTQDIVTLPAEAEELSKQLSQAQLQAISSGHASIQEKPAQIADILKNFFK